MSESGGVITILAAIAIVYMAITGRYKAVWKALSSGGDGAGGTGAGAGTGNEGAPQGTTNAVTSEPIRAWTPGM